MAYSKTLGPNGWELGQIMPKQVLGDFDPNSGELLALKNADGSDANIAGDSSSKVSNSISSSEQYVDVTEKLYVTQDAAATTAALRLKYQSDTRTELIIRNPPTNTATIRIGLKDSDNVIDANGTFATAFTIAPGRQRRLTYDRRQVFIKQDQSGVIADQFVIVTERQAIS